MKVKDLAAALGMRTIQPAGEDAVITTGYASDLLSDVMENAPEGCAFITIQAHLNTVAVATHVGAAAIIICSNRPIPNNAIAAAEKEGIAILQTEKDQFNTSHLVYTKING